MASTATDTPAASEKSGALDFVPGEKPGAVGQPVEQGSVAWSVLKQIEYYFSDNNFSKDKFLQAEAAKSPEGWVDISVIATFKRIKQLVPSGEAETIAEALQGSSFLDLSEDRTKVRRPGGGAQRGPRRSGSLCDLPARKPRARGVPTRTSISDACSAYRPPWRTGDVPHQRRMVRRAR